MQAEFDSIQERLEANDQDERDVDEFIRRLKKYAGFEVLGLKNKLCKCNFPKIIDNTKNTAKSGNAEERPDAGCEIKRWKAAAEMSSFFIVPPDISKADKPREFEGSALNSRQAASLSSKKIANCEYASPQSLTGIVHFFEISFTLIYMTLRMESSVGKIDFDFVNFLTIL